MATKLKLGSTVGAVALVMSAACTQDLSVTNPNNPDVARVLASPTDVQSLAVSSVNSWYLTASYYDPWLMLDVTADALTGNYGNFGMRFNNTEPRIDYHNIASDNDAEVARVPWNSEYTALGQANSALKAIAGGMELPGGTDQYRAIAKFSQAAATMQLALIYDQAFIVDENTDAATNPPQFQPYTEVSKAAVAEFDDVIAATSTSEGQAWQYSDASTILPLQGVTLNGKVLNRIANTMAALTLAYTPRNAADAAKVDWAKVLQYADKGIGTGSAGAPFDFTIAADGNNWYSYFVLYADDPTWLRVDQRVIHMMDPTVPEKFDGTQVAPSGNGDARLSATDENADYFFEGTVIGQASRGIYMQSPYSFRRYIYHSWQSDDPGTGPAPYILAAESDLVKAEALVRTGGDLSLAASLINNTRVGRGKLPPVTASSGTQALLDAITYERVVELMETNGFTHFYLRHADMLQDGTAHHLPVPASELETDNLPVYTFGGVGNPVENLLPSNGSKLSASLVPANGRELQLPNGSVMRLPEVVRHPLSRPLGSPRQ